MKSSLLLLFCFIGLSSLFSQGLKNPPEFNGSFSQFIEVCEELNEIKFLLEERWIDGINLQYDGKEDLKSFLVSQVQRNGLSILFRDKFIFIIPSNPLIYLSSSELGSKLGEQVEIVGENSEVEKESAKIHFNAQNATDGSPLVGAQVYAKEAALGGVTGVDGSLDIELPFGFHTIQADYLGYEQSQVQIFVRGDGTVLLELFEQSTYLDEVTISVQNAEQNVNSTLMGVNTLTLELAKKFPAIYGEVDIVKSVELLPGVSTAGEGTQGFTVRGGNRDQNLFLLDGATIYNGSHLFGFFSSINSEFIGGATLYKSSIPARFGGRASSVLAISSKEPNFKEFKMKAVVGLVSSKVSAEIPLIEDKLSMMVAGRVSYINWILKRQRNVNVRDSRGDFHDFNAKLVYRHGESDKFMISTLRSVDEFKFASDTTYGWSTQTGSFQWDHIFNKRLSMQVQSGVSDYNFTIEGLARSSPFELVSGIFNTYANTLLGFDYSSNLKMDVGFEYKYIVLDPGSFEQTVSIQETELQKEYSDISSSFFQFDLKISPRLQTESGIRFTNYRYLGSRTSNVYQEGLPRNESTVIGQQEFGSGDVISSSFNIEPRIALKFTLGLNSSLKASFNRNNQFLHSLSTTSSITPVEIWKASDQFLPPLRNDQYSFGLFKNFKNGQYETSLEVYYRELTNLIDYKNASRVLLNPAMEQAILFGDGIGYGSELYIKKNAGNLTGWISYAYSRTKKRISGNSREETINNGNLYPSELDRPHNLNLVGTYQLSRRFALSANFTYVTGVPFTGPEERYFSNGTLLTYFSERHQYRLPDYHRLDVSITMDESLRLKKKLKGSWTLSIFNLYGRQNAYSIFLGRSVRAIPPAFQVSILARMFPSITYNLSIN